MSVFVPGAGPRPCAGMVVGLAPGPLEAAARKPFQGESGKLLDEALALGDLHRDNLFMTNLVKRTIQGSRDKAIIRDLPLFVEDGLAADPYHVMILGKETARAIFPRTLRRFRNMQGLRGQIFKAGGRTWHFAFDPAHVLRRGTDHARAAFMMDVATFAAAVKAEGPRTVDTNVRIPIHTT